MRKKALLLLAFGLAAAFLCTACKAAEDDDFCNDPAKAVTPPPPTKEFAAPADVAPENSVLGPPAETPVSDPETTKQAISGDGFLTEIENQVLDLINEERLSLGLSALEFDPKLQNSARLRSKELCQHLSDQKLSHVRPDGSSWSTALTNDIAIKGLVEAGEILAREKTVDGSLDVTEHIPAKDWFLLWKASQPHYDTITWPEAQKIGVGIYYEVREGEYYTNATVHFGIYADNVPSPTN